MKIFYFLNREEFIQDEEFLFFSRIATITVEVTSPCNEDHNRAYQIFSEYFTEDRIVSIAGELVGK